LRNGVESRKCSVLITMAGMCGVDISKNGKTKTLSGTPTRGKRVVPHGQDQQAIEWFWEPQVSRKVAIPHSNLKL
jgi:hypothetical protein